MTEEHRAEIQWPEQYEPPTLEPLGTVWERTQGALGGGGDLVMLILTG